MSHEIEQSDNLDILNWFYHIVKIFGLLLADIFAEKLFNV